MSAPAKLTPNDPRVEHRNVMVRGKNYHYLLAKPEGPHKATVLLCHGFPDLSFGWRNQIPALQAAGYQVVAPDMLGYGGTDAPDAVEAYGSKGMSDDLAALLDADFPTEPRVVIGGHDWGGMLVWRFAEHHPDRVLGVFSVCTPYVPPQGEFYDLSQVTQVLPNFRYQLQFAGDEVVKRTAEGGKPAVRQFLNCLWGGRPKEGSDGKPFSVDTGVPFGHIADLETSRLLSDEELDFYADQYSRNGLRGPTNWYRSRRVNFDEDRGLYARGKDFKIQTPALFISATRDAALPEAMSAGMDAHFANLSRGRVDASHWALTEASAEVNRQIEEFVDRVTRPKASI
ncbi:hypothetical protein RB601_001275 [Gaeumannomyces tritici]